MLVPSQISWGITWSNLQSLVRTSCDKNILLCKKLWTSTEIRSLVFSRSFPSSLVFSLFLSTSHILIPCFTLLRCCPFQPCSLSNRVFHLILLNFQPFQLCSQTEVSFLQPKLRLAKLLALIIPTTLNININFWIFSKKKSKFLFLFNKIFPPPQNDVL